MLFNLVDDVLFHNSFFLLLSFYFLWVLENCLLILSIKKTFYMKNFRLRWSLWNLLESPSSSSARKIFYRFNLKRIAFFLSRGFNFYNHNGKFLFKECIYFIKCLLCHKYSSRWCLVKNKFTWKLFLSFNRWTLKIRVK